jgi:hypothetical protein
MAEIVNHGPAVGEEIDQCVAAARQEIEEKVGMALRLLWNQAETEVQG